MADAIWGSSAAREWSNEMLFDCDGDAKFDQTFTVEADCDRALVADWDLDGTMDLITISLKHMGLAVWQGENAGQPGCVGRASVWLEGRRANCR